MAFDCRALIERYVSWLTDGFEVKDYGEGGCRVITPYWHSDGDHIEMFALPTDDGKVIITDEGLTTDWLYAVGIDTDSDARHATIEQIAKRNGLDFKDGELRVELDYDSIEMGLHRFLTAVRAVSQMSMLRRQRGTPTFKEEVELYLLQNDQTVESRFKVTGRTMEHTVDFYLNTGRNVLLEALTATSLEGARSSAKNVAFKWIDIREQGWDYQRVVVLDDSEDKWEDIWSNERVIRPLEVYSDKLIRWSSERGQLLGPLTDEA